MKILTRTMILITVAITFIMMQITLGQLITREDELNTIAREAISTVQISAREQIEDRVYGTHNATCNANDSCYKSNDDYLNDLVNNLKPLISTKSNYSIDVYGVNYEKGLLDVGINCTYSTFKGKKTITVRKTSIVEVIGQLPDEVDDSDIDNTEFDVEIDLNGGSGEILYQGGNSNLGGSKGTEIILPNNTLVGSNGEDFNCYNTKANGEGRCYAIGEVYTINKNITLYATYATNNGD